MRVVGIDPGYGRVGWAILEGDVNTQRLLGCGCFETESGHSLNKRLVLIHSFIDKLIDDYDPDEAAVEDIFYFKNAKTVIGVGQARGVIILSFSLRGIQVFDYTPLAVKLSVAGYGKAEKAQVQKMVKSLLKLEKIPEPDDVADACATALTHIFSNKHLV